MKFFRIAGLLLVLYFILPISIKTLSEYDMNRVLLGEKPMFCIEVEHKGGSSAKIYYGLFYRIISVEKTVFDRKAREESVISGPMLDYNGAIRKLYFWTGHLFDETQSLRIVRSSSSHPIQI